MDGWIFRQGFPLVTVEAEGHGRNRPFQPASVPLSGRWRRHEIHWQVPITYRARVNGEHRARPHPSLDRGRSRRLPGQAGLGRGERGRATASIVCSTGGHSSHRSSAHPPKRWRPSSDSTWSATPGRRPWPGMLPAADFLELTARFRHEDRPARVDARSWRRSGISRGSSRPIFGPAWKRWSAIGWARRRGAARLVFEGRRERP